MNYTLYIEGIVRAGDEAGVQWFQNFELETQDDWNDFFHHLQNAITDENNRSLITLLEVDGKDWE